jgi:hypothetical protein
MQAFIAVAIWALTSASAAPGLTTTDPDPRGVLVAFDEAEQAFGLRYDELGLVGSAPLVGLEASFSATESNR